MVAITRLSVRLNEGFGPFKVRKSISDTHMRFTGDKKNKTDRETEPEANSGSCRNASMHTYSFKRNTAVDINTDFQCCP